MRASPNGQAEFWGSKEVVPFQTALLLPDLPHDSSASLTGVSNFDQWPGQYRTDTRMRLQYKLLDFAASNEAALCPILRRRYATLQEDTSHHHSYSASGATDLRSMGGAKVALCGDWDDIAALDIRCLGIFPSKLDAVMHLVVGATLNESIVFHRFPGPRVEFARGWKYLVESNYEAGGELIPYPFPHQYYYGRGISPQKVTVRNVIKDVRHNN